MRKKRTCHGCRALGSGLECRLGYTMSLDLKPYTPCPKPRTIKALILAEMHKEVREEKSFLEKTRGGAK